jgi:pilus assembly protein Flp/PilA
LFEGGEKAMGWISKFIKEDSGATAVEYGIMVAAIAAVIIAVVFVVGTKVDTAFEAVNTAMN